MQTLGSFQHGSKTSRYICAALVVAVLAWAICLRIVVLSLMDGRILSGDPASYVNIAQNILAGHGFVRDHSPLPVVGLRAYYPPLYPALLAGVGLLLPLAPIAYAALNLLIDLATALAIVGLARSIQLPREVGIAAACVYLLWPTVILNSPVPQKEGLATLLAVLSLTFLVDRRPVLFGAASGLLALAQPALVTLPAIAALCLYWRNGWLRFVALSASIAGLVLLPWWVRNYLTFGQFVPLTTGSGMNFWVGTMGDGIAYNREVEKFTRLPEIERTPAAFRDAFAYISADPVEYARHTFGKIVALFDGDLWGAKPLFWMKPIEPGTLWLKQVPYAASLSIFGAAAIGAFLIRNRNLKLLVAACLLQLFAVLIWFQLAERHRYFMVPFLMLLSVDGVRRVSANLRDVAAEYGGHGKRSSPFQRETSD